MGLREEKNRKAEMKILEIHYLTICAERQILKAMDLKFIPSLTQGILSSLFTLGTICQVLVLLSLYGQVALGQSPCVQSIDFNTGELGQQATVVALWNGNVATELQSVQIELSFTPISGGNFASDLMVGICDPAGQCLEFGGYSGSFGFGDVGDFPNAWDSGASGIYTATIDASAAGLSGDGDWEITFMNTYPGAVGQWIGTLTFIEDCSPVGDLEGCTDDAACNFNPDAMVDDGSCAYFTPVCPCSVEIQVDALLDAGDLEEIAFDAPFVGGLIGIAFELEFTPGTSENYAGDLAIGLCDASSSCLELGGYDLAFEFLDIGNFPDNWEGAPGNYAAEFDAMNAGLIGSGEWTLMLLNAYSAAVSPAQWSGTVVLTGFCEEVPLGCTDSLACNFNELAIMPDGTCELPPLGYDCAGQCLQDTDGDGVCDDFEIPGCSDETAVNYDPLATDDNGSNCVYAGLVGCMAENACNFDPMATQFGPCTYPELGLDCLGDCENDADGDGVCDAFEIVGCSDSAACNFDPDATESGCCIYAENLEECWCVADVNDNEICDHFEVSGCTSSWACNYNPLATLSDGSCLTTNAPCENPNPCSWYATVALGCYCVPGPYAGDSDGDGVCDPMEIMGCQDSTAVNYNVLATDPGLDCIYIHTYGCMDERADNYDSLATADDLTCTSSTLVVEGCTDAEACNYYSLAAIDDGSCLLFEGCTDAEACNYVPIAQTDDGSCVYAEYGYNCAGECSSDEDEDGVCDDLEVFGCTDEAAANYVDQATENDGTCLYPSCELSGSFCYENDTFGAPPYQLYLYQSTPPGEVMYFHILSGGIESYDEMIILDGLLSESSQELWSIDPTGNGLVQDLSGISLTSLTGKIAVYINADYSVACGETGVDPIVWEASCELFGCTDPAYSNYDPSATEDDGSCAHIGCTDEAACNFDLANTLDDGSCDYASCVGCTEEWAFNYSSSNTIDDGSCYHLCERLIYPKINGSAHQTLHACAGEPINLSASIAGADGNETWEWTGDAASLMADGVNLSGSLPAGMYYIGFSALDTSAMFGNPYAACVYGESASIHIAVAESPHMEVIGSQAICQDENASLEVQVEWLDQFPVQDSTFDVHRIVAIPDFSGNGGNASMGFAQLNQEIHDLAGNTVVLDGASDLLEIHADLTHTYLGDLIFTVICPNGQSIVLMDRRGGGMDVDGEIVWASDADFPANNLVWNMNVHDQPLLPEQPFNDLDGCPVNGTWSLWVTDGSSGDVGTLRNWGLTLADVAPAENPQALEPCDGFWQGGLLIEPCPACNTATVPTDALGIFEYTFTVQDDFGCAWDTTLTVEIIEPGCMDALASNYDETSTCSGACIYPSCTDPEANNYDPNALEDDGSCDYTLYSGCTDPMACNFDDEANVDDGSCTWDATCACSDSFSFDTGILNGGASLVSSFASNVVELDSLHLDLEFEQDETYSTNFSWLTDLVLGVCSGDENCVEFSGHAMQGLNVGLGHENWGYFSSYPNGEEVFAFEGTFDLTEAGLEGDGDWDFEFLNGYAISYARGHWWGSITLHGTCEAPPVPGCMDPLACDFNPLAETEGACSYPPAEYDCAGTCLQDTDLDGVCDAFEMAGCTAEGALNFNASATDDDGSCAWPLVLGCTYMDASNFNPLAEDDDGSCSFNMGSNACPADLNEDGLVTISDLLLVLAAYGDDCE